MPGCWTSFLDIFPCFRKDPSDKQFTKATEAYDRYKSTGNPDDLDTALSHFHLASTSRRNTKDDRARLSLETILAAYADALWSRYNKEKSAVNLDKVIKLDEQVCSIWEKQDEATRSPQYPAKLLDLGNAYFYQYRDYSSPDSFPKVIEKYDRLLNGKLAISEKIRKMGLMRYGVALTTWCDNQATPRASQTKKRLDKAISYMTQALTLDGKQESEAEEKEARTIREKCLFNLAIAHFMRYHDNGNIVELDTAIGYNRQTRDLLSRDHVDLSFCLFDLAQQLFLKYQYEQSQTDHQLLLDIHSKASRGIGALMEAKRIANEALVGIEGHEGVQYDDMRADLQKLLDTVEQHSKSVSKKSSRTAVAPPDGSGSSVGSHA